MINKKVLRKQCDSSDVYDSVSPIYQDISEIDISLIQSKQDLRTLTEYIDDTTSCDVIIYCGLIRKIIERSRVNGDKMCQYISEINIPTKLAKYIGGDPDVQAEVTWVLINLSAGTTRDSNAVAGSCLSPIFLNLQSSASLHVRQLSIWALSNLCCEEELYRSVMLLDPVQEVYRFYNDACKTVNNNEIIDIVCWSLRNFTTWLSCLTNIRDIVDLALGVLHEVGLIYWTVDGLRTIERVVFCLKSQEYVSFVVSMLVKHDIMETLASNRHHLNDESISAGLGETLIRTGDKRVDAD